MRLCEDISLSLGTLSGDERLDLILGGHDHHVVRRTATDLDDDPTVVEQGTRNSSAACTEFQGKVRIIKSGTDWRGLSVARLVLNRSADGTAVISEVRRE
jgi:2',3'-cyclic-nucleotide 2'-phosphodiesterase (5'-nucleotidase family)